ncbi:putative calpain-like cysteine peptidase [Trypanosoma conorhini]|uniref:Putative calpain-like cysteine peptidase n=1 Tax=Trypanosoma conorhini TaxID=83891 RepID=A0A422Q8U5_9TRYP|nr:putative calpain-like cysteine peptidase [Trypanosoma conorhini]RNF26391.1 putative calpain-like cysteine peptidase [Trypanosoma conorhini]
MRRLPCTAATDSAEENERGVSNLLPGKWTPIHRSSAPAVRLSECTHPSIEEECTGVSGDGEVNAPRAPQSSLPTTIALPQGGGAGGSDVRAGSAHVTRPAGPATPAKRGDAVPPSCPARRSSGRTGVDFAPAVLSAKALLSQNTRETLPGSPPLASRCPSPLRLPLCNSVLEEAQHARDPAPAQQPEKVEKGSQEEHLLPGSCRPQLRQQQQPSSSPLSPNAGKGVGLETEAHQHRLSYPPRGVRRGALMRRPRRHPAATVFSTVDTVATSDSTPTTVSLPALQAPLRETPRPPNAPFSPERKKEKGFLSAVPESRSPPSVASAEKASKSVSVASGAGAASLARPAQFPAFGTALEAGSSAVNASSILPAGGNAVGEEKRPAPKTMGMAATRKRDSGPSHMTLASGTHSHAASLRRTPSRGRLSRLVQRVSDAEVLYLIREHVYRSYSGPRCDALIELCDTLLKELEESPSGRGVGRASERDGAAAEDDDGEGDGKSSLGAAEDYSSDEDEFDDGKIRETAYPTSDPHRKYSFASPAVQGATTRVFSSGMLYKIRTESGEIFFFNDTLQYVMVVRVRCQLCGDETIDEKVVQAEVGGGETELTLAVPPEGTSLLMQTSRTLPRVRVKGVRPPKDFAAPSVRYNVQEISAGVDKVREKLGPWDRAGDQKAFLKCCLNNGLKFIDLQFRPAAASLCRPGVDAVTLTPLTWRRPAGYLMLTEVSQARLFRRNISCQLVRQGSLQDHTVIAGIAAVATFPTHVRWMFRHPVSSANGKRERAAGAYRVTLCIGGWWTTLLLDDYFPASLKAPLFARCAVDPRRLWVSFLEKAYAKALGSYAALCSADALEVLTDFTGFPCRNLDELWSEAANNPEAAKLLYKYIHTCARRNFLVMVYTASPLTSSSASSLEITRRLSMRFIGSADALPLFLPGHVYFITEALYYEDLDLCMVRLKNPWTWCAAGQPQTRTKWRRSKWFEQPESSLTMGAVGGATPQAKREDGGGSSETALRKKELGTMWLEWSEALASFEGGGACYTLWSWHDYRVQSRFRQHVPAVVLEVRVGRKVEVVLTLSQESRLRHLGTATTPPYKAMLLLASRHVAASRTEALAYTSSGDIERPGGKMVYCAARDVSLKCSLEPKHSPYYVIPRLQSPDGQEETPFVVSLLCDVVVGGEEAQVHFRRLDPSCQVFQDPRCFTVSAELCTPVTATYQHRTPAGVSTCVGQCIKQ